MTYGQIASLAGSPRGARQVVRILHSLSRIHELPWHRVVNIKGEVAITNEEARVMQIYLLQNENVMCSDHGQVDLAVLFLCWRRNINLIIGLGKKKGRLA